MATRSRSIRPSTRKRSAAIEALTRERMLVRRADELHRQIARNARELRRSIDRAHGALMELLYDVARRTDYVVQRREDVVATTDRQRVLERQLVEVSQRANRLEEIVRTSGAERLINDLTENRLQLAEEQPAGV